MVQWTSYTLSADKASLAVLIWTYKGNTAMKWRFLYGCKKESVVEQEASAVAKEWQYYRNRTEKKAEKRKKERPLFSFCNELASTRLLPHGLPSHSASSNFAPLSKDSLASHCWSREQERDFRELETHSSKLAQGDANREQQQPLQQSLRASFFYLHSFYSIRHQKRSSKVSFLYPTFF